MRITATQLAELTQTGRVAIRDDAHAITGEAASLDMLGVALRRLDASAARHRPQCCPDCCEDLPEHHTATLCDECAARRHEFGEEARPCAAEEVHAASGCAP